MKRLHFLTILLLFSGFLATKVSGQDDENEIDDDDDILVPQNVDSFVVESTPPHAIIGWPAVEDAASYVLRIYRSSDNALFREIQNQVISFVNVTDLESGTNYTATVSAVYFTESGRRFESEESVPTFFSTRPACRGRQVHLPCTAHCVSTCEDPDPVCSRECVPGCGCPANLPIWFQSGCIPRVLCPPPTGSPVIPRNLQVERGGNGEVIVVWEPIENAASYTVQVRQADATDTVVQTMISPISIVAITGLNPDEAYIFSVSVTLAPQNDPGEVGRNAILPPENIAASAITNTSFRVQWTPRGDAVRYAFVLYDENQAVSLYSNDKIAGSIINIDSLAPGTTYYYSVASARRLSNPGIFSPLASVQTKGNGSSAGFMHAAVVVDIPESTTAPTTTSTTTTATTTTTTTTTTTRPLTACLQEYESIRQFYVTFPDEDRETGPRFPNCDSEGLYVTRLCEQTNQNACSCIQPENGEKIIGSDFGGSNSAFQLDCDQFGMLGERVENFRFRDVTSTSVTLMWDLVDGVNGYVVTITDGIQEDRTIFVESNVQLTLTDLISGLRYAFGVYALNSQGWSGPISSIQLTTLVVDTPQNLRVTATSANSVTVAWDHSPGADEYEVGLILVESNEVIMSVAEIVTTSFTFTNLNASVEYRIEVRAIAVQYEPENENESTIHRTDPASVEFTLQGQCQLPPLDLLYVIDSSANVGWLNLQSVKRFLRNITLTVPSVNQVDGTRVSVVKYYRIARTSFSFARFNSTSSVLLGLRWLSYNGGRTRNISRALDFVRRFYFSTASNSLHRPRPNALPIVIFFSVGGPSSDFERTRRAAASLRQVANVISMGVEGESDDTLLDTIASRSDLKSVAPSFRSLSSLNTSIVEKFCSLL